MAIVKMQKISVVGLRSFLPQISDTLMELGAVDVNTQEQKLIDDEWANLVLKDGNEEEVAKIDADLAKTSLVLEVLDKYSDEKKPLFRSKRLIEKQNFNDVLSKQEELHAYIEKIYSLSEKLSALKSDENKLNSLLQTLEPWVTYDVDLALASTDFCTVMTGVFPVMVNMEELVKELSEKALNCYVGLIGSDSDQHYTYVVYKTEDEDDVFAVLKQYAFNKMVFKDLTGTAASNIAAAKKQILSIEDERKEIEEQIKNLYQWKFDIEFIYDDLLIKRDKAKIAEKMLRTEKTFYLDGWVPVRCAQQVQEKLEKMDCIIELAEPEESDDVPVLLANNRFVEPIESITNLYSIPAYKSVDPTPFFALFYCLFYGLMLSDAGYGLIMALGCFLILKKFRLQGTAKKMITSFMYCGVFTIFWGLMFGGFFGDAISTIARLFFHADVTISPVWFDPVSQPMILLVLSFIFGIIHLFIGMGLKAHLLVKEGHPWSALFDIGFWYLTLAGIILWIVGSFGMSALSKAGQYMTIAGALGLVLTQGRNEKNIVMKFLKGVLSLYDVSGYFSDILSYSRLLALGLATGVIASVVNIIGSLGGNSILGFILFVVIFVFGHLLNMAINALGSFVHASRLQYVEFFGKFFEGGGKAFAPFKKSTKYIDIV